MTAAPQEDAALMMAASTTTATTTSSTKNNKNNSSKNNATSSASSGTDALARSNLLRLEATELLRESYLHVHPAGDGSHAHYEAKWAPDVRSYLEDVKEILGGLGEATLGPNVALLSSSGGANEEVKYRIPLLSDKFVKSTTHGESNKGNSSSNNPLTSWSFPFSGGSALSVHPVGSFAHSGNAGLANKHANGIGGDVLPVLDVAVLVDSKNDNGGEGDAFVGGKDYLNHRYTDKRNILAVHVAKQLSQKKHRTKVGAVHLTHVFGDSRKVGLVLTPPLESNEEDSKADKKKRKRGKKEKESKSKGKKKGNKLRFRIRLIFGVQQGEVANPNSSNDEYSSDEEAPTNGSLNSWIPRSRLLPNRSNNRSSKLSDGDNDDNSSNGTPHYSNSIAEDLHLLSTTDLVNSTLSSLISGSNNVTPTCPFHETLLLVKVWALQRGFLRGHDSFTTTTLAVILVYLYRTKAIGRRMGCVQGFIAFMKFWSENDWLGEDDEGSALLSANNAQSSLSASAVRERKMKHKAAFVIPSEGRNESQTVSNCSQAHLYLEDVHGNTNSSTPRTLLDCYKAVYTSSTSCSSSSVSNNGQHVDSPILLDPSMTLNYLARLSPSFVRESRAEAYAALRYIHGQEREGSDIGAFRKLFLETNRFWTRYDAYVRIPLSVVPKMFGGESKTKKKKHGKVSNHSSSGGDAAKLWGNDIDDLGYDESVCRGVVEVISRAMGDRATAIRAFTCGNGSGSIGSSEAKDSEDVATKMIVDSEQSYIVPIRGNSSTFGYAEKLEERNSMPTAASANTKEEPCLVVGLCLDPNTSRRIVDRGPPAEDVEGSSGFVSLWGEKAAQLRRFQDGAIVRAVVWNDDSSTKSPGNTVQFCGMDLSMGGIVERITAHIIKLHFTDVKKQKKSHHPKLLSPTTFELRDMVSLIDGVAPSSSPFADSLALHKNVMSAFTSLADFLRSNTATSFESISVGKGKKTSKLGLPLSIDEVEPLSPCLRYSALFPPVPHPLLGGSHLAGEKKVSGVNAGSPVLIQIRFSSSSKWPASLNAMGAAKCAMLVQLAEGIEKMKEESGGELDAFDGPMDVTPNYLDVGYSGYSWRIIVRADQELRMLRGLRNPNEEAKALQLNLINRHVRGAMHHSLINAIHTRNPSASSVVRLAHRWVASHMLSDMIPTEALELMVAKIYTESAASEGEVESNNKSKMTGPVDTPPSTVVAGFLRFLQLLSTHDWAREPLIVDPQSHISPHDRSLIHTHFKVIRGGPANRNNGPAMYIVSPADYDGVEEMAGSKVVGDDTNGNGQQVSGAINATEKMWAPTVTAQFPEMVVLSRAVALAKCSHRHLTACIMNGNSVGSNNWVAAFQESSASLTSYSALLRVDPSYVIDPGCSSANADCTVGGAKSETPQLLLAPFEKSLRKKYAGLKELRKKYYKNLILEKDTLHEFQPVKSLVKALRSKYGEYAVFFYNELAPDVIALIWRPDAFNNKPQQFSAIVAEFKRPTAEYWKNDSLVMANTDDLMAEIGYFSRGIVSNFKVFDDKKPVDVRQEKKPPKKKTREEDKSDESSDSEEE